MRFWHSSGNCTPPTLPHTSKKGIERQVKQLAPCYLLSCKFRPSPVQNFMLDRGEEPEGMGAGVLKVNVVTVTVATSAGLWPQWGPELYLPFLSPRAFAKHLQPLARPSHMILPTTSHSPCCVSCMPTVLVVHFVFNHPTGKVLILPFP